MTMSYSGDFRGLLGLLGALIVRIGKRALRVDLPSLKALLESRSS